MKTIEQTSIVIRFIHTNRKGEQSDYLVGRVISEGVAQGSEFPLGSTADNPTAAELIAVTVGGPATDERPEGYTYGDVRKALAGWLDENGFNATKRSARSVPISTDNAPPVLTVDASANDSEEQDAINAACSDPNAPIPFANASDVAGHGGPTKDQLRTMARIRNLNHGAALSKTDLAKSLLAHERGTVDTRPEVAGDDAPPAWLSAFRKSLVEDMDARMDAKLDTVIRNANAS